jgi:D-inositol-3-phosphate glycosyltransferase
MFTPKDRWRFRQHGGAGTVSSEIASVALVSEHASPLGNPGGAESGGQNVYVAALANELARRGIDIVVYTRRTDKRQPRRVQLAQNVTLEHVDAGPPAEVARDSLLPFMRQFGDELRNAWRKSRPDVIHAHYWMSGIAAMRAAVPLRLPVVQTFHALGVTKRRHQGHNDPSHPARIRAEAALASSADAVAATSREELADLLRCGARPRRVEVVPCGVDTTLFSPAAGQRRPARRIAAVGRLVERKGVDEVVRSLPQLPDVSLVVAGGSGLRGDADARRLHLLAQRLGVAERVDLIGPVQHTAVPALLRSADAVVCVPWYEPFGMVALEAMACAVPVVTTAVGGLRETVVNGETGLHVPVHDRMRLESAITTLLDDRVMCRRLGARGAQRAAARYTWERVADSLLQLYADAAGRGTS